MEKTDAYMIQLIKSEISTDKTCEQKAATLSAEEAVSLYKLAVRHDVAHIVGSAVCRLDLFPGTKVRALFEKQVFAAVYRAEQMQRELSSLCEAFERAAIPFIPLKGAVLRAMYPEPFLRNSCDIDVLVHDTDLPRAENTLAALGYTRNAQTAHDVSLISPSGIPIELHFRLMEEGVSRKVQDLLGRVWEDASPIKDGSSHYRLSDGMFYCYHIAHMAKHYLIGGCGIRPFLDIWMMERGNHRMEDARALLDTCGLSVFAEKAEALSHVFFSEGQHTDLTGEMADFVLTGGLFGSLESRVAVTQAKKGGKMRQRLSRIFLPYDIMKFRYPALQKHRWLLPAYQVRRWARLLFCGASKQAAKEWKTIGATSSETRTALAAHLSKLGLL